MSSRSCMIGLSSALLGMGGFFHGVGCYGQTAGVTCDLGQRLRGDPGERCTHAGVPDQDACPSHRRERHA